MAEITIPLRSEIPLKYTWNATSIFASSEAWEAELQSVLASLSELDRFRGHLGDSPVTLVEANEVIDRLVYRAGKVSIYADMSHEVDTGNQAAVRMSSQAMSLMGRVRAALAFLDPELLAIGEDTLRTWIATEPRLANYSHYVDNLFRRQAHVRSQEVEEVMGLLVDPFSGVSQVAGILTDSDFKFPPATTNDAVEAPVTQGTYDTLLASPDRTVRQTAWESYTDTYLAFKNTLAANLVTSVKQNVFMARVRRHPSTLAAALFYPNIPPVVFHNLIDTFRANLPTWHRYWAVRRRALGVEQLYPYDIWAPLTAKRPQISYEQAVDWIGEALKPLGAAYVQTLRRGCLEDRWVDVLPNQGKAGGAFSSGRPGTHPFILMSYDDTIFSLSTLAHELGHSMHSYLTWQHQPIIYSRYSLFAAEVASNFNQAMVRAYLLQNYPDPDFQISVIEEAMSNFHRYFFIMPTLARFELEIHERIERGEGVTADDMMGLMADLFSEGYGGQMTVDHERVGITWATFPHLYADYYVYQYATGISAAHALTQPVLAGADDAAAAYLNFLKAGGSLYPLEALKLAGTDLTTPQPVEAAFKILSELVDRLEQLVTVHHQK
ncbi:MAG: oligoendopeptidase F [Anaerolineae bacterium]